MAYPKKVKCTVCGNRHDLRPEFADTPDVAICASCLKDLDVVGIITIDETKPAPEPTVVPVTSDPTTYDIKVWLATIPSAGSRSNYVCHLRKVARMLGAIDENCLNWATVDLGEVVAAVDAAGLKPSYASQVKTAVRGLKSYFETQA